MAGFRCPECGGVGSAPTHRRDCPRRGWTLLQEALAAAVGVPGRPRPVPRREVSR
jgi:hypothetical protein